MAAKKPLAAPPSRADANAAVGRIYQRRLKVDDPDLHRFADDPAEAIDYVRRNRHVPRSVLAGDAADVLLLVRYLRGLLDRAELDALRLGRDAGLTWRSLGEALGVASPQAAEQRAVRLEADRRRFPRRPEALRSQIRRDKLLRRWLSLHAAEVFAAASGVVRDRARLPAAVEGGSEWLDGIEEILSAYAGSAGEQASLLAHFRLLARDCNIDQLEAGATTTGSLREVLRLAAEFTAMEALTLADHADQ